MKRIVGSLTLILAVAAVGLAQSNFYFPQVADGTQAGGITWVTTIAITNSGAPGSDPASGTISFFQSNGSALVIGFMDETKKTVSAGNSITFNNIGPGQTHFYTSTAAGALNIGFAHLSSSAPVTGTAVFSEKQGATTIAQAAVFSSSPLTKQGTFVIEDNSNDTAVAIANPTSSLANISFQLFDTSGNTVAAVNNYTLSSQNQTAAFVSQIFPANSFTRPVYGTMQVSGGTPLVMTALLFTGGGQFFTFPTITYASLVGDPLDSLERMWGTLRAEFRALV